MMGNYNGCQVDAAVSSHTPLSTSLTITEPYYDQTKVVTGWALTLKTVLSFVQESPLAGLGLIMTEVIKTSGKIDTEKTESLLTNDNTHIRCLD